MILYGSRIRINCWYPGNIGNWRLHYSHILEILEISIFIFPHNIEKSQIPKLIPSLDITLLEKNKNPKLIPKLDITLLNVVV